MPSVVVSPTSPSASAPSAPSSAPSLTVGDATTVDWTPRAGLAGRINLHVTALQQAPWNYFAGWQVPQNTKATTRPYFVRATVANVGNVDLGGQPVPLYVQDAANQLVAASTFGSSTGSQSFHPCHPDRLPRRFPHGARVHTCLVMLVPHRSRVVGVTYRPQVTDQPITWTGTPTRLRNRGHGS